MKVNVLGAAVTPVRASLTTTVREMIMDVFLRAVEDAGVGPEEVEGLFITPLGFAGMSSAMLACNMADYLGLNLKSLSMEECGGTSSTSAFHYAMDEVLTGRNRINVAIGLDVKFDPFEDFEYGLPESIFTQHALYGVHFARYGIGTPVPFYAMSSQRYMHEYGVTPRDAAQLAVLLRGNACKNPNAQFRKPITVDEVLSSRMISPPLRLLDCSTFSTGAAACVLAAEDVRGTKPIVDIKGFGEFHHASNFIPVRASITTFESARRASAEAYGAAGVKPDDIDVAEVYDVFTYTELMIYEDLGFFEKGTAARHVRDGETGTDGRIPINPSGGRLSLGHPAGATPLFELAEVLWQLRGEAGERQVKAPRLGLVHAEHGMLNGGIVIIMERH
ncbi:MAG: thiolase family protein [Deltaproteobacteria bacterium]|nr:thiolase family protein [Deltaproteobacteria bacterium]MCL5276651.1 thiolase family protein [Deltaproteobacteria bacterium]